MDDMQSLWGIIGVIVFFCGFYALYAFIRLKRRGEINATLLLGKEYLYKKCKDKESYTRKAGPALLIFGLVSVIYGVLDIIHCYVHPMTMVDTAGMFIFFVVLVWFAVYTSKLKRMYF